MDKPFKTLKEQVELLDARELTITDNNYVENYLLQNNYYYLINGFAKFLQVSTNKYDKKYSFNDIITIHIFDKKIRDLTFSYIVTIEHRLKSYLSYEIAKKYHTHSNNIITVLQLLKLQIDKSDPDSADAVKT